MRRKDRARLPHETRRRGEEEEEVNPDNDRDVKEKQKKKKSPTREPRTFTTRVLLITNLSRDGRRRFATFVGGGARVLRCDTRSRVLSSSLLPASSPLDALFFRLRTNFPKHALVRFVCPIRKSEVQSPTRATRAVMLQPRYLRTPFPPSLSVSFPSRSQILFHVCVCSGISHL